MGWGGEVVVAHKNLVSAQGPLVLGFGVLGPRVWSQGLTILAFLGVTAFGVCLHLHKM